MRKLRVLGAVLALSSPFVLAACGDDEDDSGPTSGTCDLRTVNFSCIEREATPAEIESQEDFCDQNGGTWSLDPCPTEDLVGCCSYVYGDPFNQCFYEGTTTDGASFCADPMFEDAVWTPAS
jgi:hypothetical protein